jgi:uncharacterized membrane protein YcjF (UPF0283 family)
MAEYLKYGATGLVALIVLAVLVPVIRAFVEELKASRQERQEMRHEHNEFVINHARHTTEALLQVKDGLEQVCRRLNGDRE